MYQEPAGKGQQRNDKIRIEETPTRRLFTSFECGIGYNRKHYCSFAVCGFTSNTKLAAFAVLNSAIIHIPVKNIPGGSLREREDYKKTWQ